MTNASHGNFVWYDLLSRDPKASKAFYGEVVGWKTERFGGDSHYEMWLGSQGPLGGVMELPTEAAKMGAPPHWMGNVQVDNLDASVALVKKLGGTIHKEPEQIPTVGRFAIIADPQGASLSLFQPDKAMELHDRSKEGEFCWNELMTTDSAAAAKFYTSLLGWKILQEMDMGPMGTYQVFGVGDKQLGGMMNIPGGTGMPPMWIYYTETKNLDAAISRSTKQGAKLINGPMDVPGGGRIAQFIDPQGVMFALHQYVGPSAE
jgi:predicted enzyme related to lactoylglutathione lyase